MAHLLTQGRMKQMANYNPDYDYNYATNLSPAIKAKITAYRKAVEDHAFKGSRNPKDAEEIVEALKVARGDLEQTIITHLKRAAK